MINAKRLQTLTALLMLGLVFVIGAIPVLAQPALFGGSDGGSGGGSTTSGTGTGISAGSSINVCTFIAPICKAIFGDRYTEGGPIPVNESGQIALGFITGRANTVLSLVFIGIIIMAVYIIVTSGIQYVRSKGDEKEIAAANKAIKSVFVGIGVLFVGVVGVILVLAFFGGLGLLDSTQTIEDVITPPVI